MTLAEDELGEGVIWDDRTDTLVWVDIQRGLVKRSLLLGQTVGTPQATLVDTTVGAVALAEDGGLLVAGAKRLHTIDPLGVSHPGPALIESERRARLNDGAVDPAGRYLVGTLTLDQRKNEELLFQVGEDTGIRTLRTGLGLSNGIDWSPNGDRIYHIDTPTAVVWSATYEAESGEVGEWQPHFEVREGLPDGLTVDADGDLWIAVWGAGQVRQYTSTGEVKIVVEVDAPNVSCPAFVGPRLDLLAITTAQDELSPSQLDQYPWSGALFLVPTTATGLPSRRWAGNTTTPVWPEPVSGANS